MAPLQYSAWRIPWGGGSGRLQTMGLKSRAWLSDFTTFSFMLEKMAARLWCSCLRESRDGGTWWTCRLWSAYQRLDTTGRLGSNGSSSGGGSGGGGVLGVGCGMWDQLHCQCRGSSCWLACGLNNARHRRSWCHGMWDLVTVRHPALAPCRQVITTGPAGSHNRGV